MLLWGVTVKLFGRGPLAEEPEELPILGIDGPPSGRLESAIPVSLRFQFCIILEVGLVSGLTRSICDLSFAESKEPGRLGGA